MCAAALLSVAAATMSLFAERQPYSRYESIVDRQMFGAPPPGFDPTKPPSEVSKADAKAAEAQLTKEQEQIKSAIHFSVINVTPKGETAVGFTDNGDAKNPVHYYLKVGEQRNGWTVKEADPVNATMTIAKGDVEVSLSIGGNSAQGAKSPNSGPAAAQQSDSKRRPASVLSAQRQGEGQNTLDSLRSRRMMREQQRQKAAEDLAAEKAAAEERRREEEARREEERLQREVEREELREQLQLIREEQRRVREEQAVAKEQNAPADGEQEEEE